MFLRFPVCDSSKQEVHTHKTRFLQPQNYLLLLGVVQEYYLGENWLLMHTKTEENDATFNKCFQQAYSSVSQCRLMGAQFSAQ